ncbi:MAG TPA: DUF3368 domain-containing protein [Gammaproteobacteria bacterium]|nr:DUF3368 domain-containing protein [Gammaproteobacteria bacterium]
MLLISDTNILIDMSVAGLLESMFGLPERFAVPDVLFVEELGERHPELLTLGLVTLSLDGEGVMEAYRVRADCTGRAAPSLNDLFALMLARQVGGILLTGDRRLRELTESRYSEVGVRGTLWIVRRLMEHGLLEASAAREAYRRMKQSGSRLPWGEVNRQLVEWGVNPF